MLVTGSFKLIVSNPCTEDWNSMTQREIGKHCLSCDNTVIDFSGMTDREIQSFFIQNKHKQVCGRFKKTQLERIVIHLPANFFSKKIPVWQKYLIILLICFGSNLFSLDVIIGNNSLNAQEIQIAATQEQRVYQKKRTKKKKYKKNKERWETIKFEQFILGFTQTIPLLKHPIVNITNPVSKKNNELLNSDSLSVNKEDEKPSKENPNEKNKKEPIEFILPQTVLMKRRKSK